MENILKTCFEYKLAEKTLLKKVFPGLITPFSGPFPAELIELLIEIYYPVPRGAGRATSSEYRAARPGCVAHARHGPDASHHVLSLIFPAEPTGGMPIGHGAYTPPTPEWNFFLNRRTQTHAFLRDRFGVERCCDRSSRRETPYGNFFRDFPRVSISTPRRRGGPAAPPARWKVLGSTVKYKRTVEK